jgi:hypothetical protein
MKIESIHLSPPQEIHKLTIVFLSTAGEQVTYVVRGTREEMDTFASDARCCERYGVLEGFLNSLKGTK